MCANANINVSKYCIITYYPSTLVFFFIYLDAIQNISACNTNPMPPKSQIGILEDHKGVLGSLWVKKTD